jgi:PAS domain S-box-containing protein
MLDRRRFVAALRASAWPFFVIAALHGFGYLEVVSLKFLDVYGRLFAQHTPAPEVVVVAFDRGDLKRFGSDSVRGDQMTRQVLEKLLAADVAAVGIGIAPNFKQPDSPALIATIKAHPARVVVMDTREVLALGLSSAVEPLPELAAQSATLSVHVDVDRVARRQIIAWRAIDSRTGKDTGRFDTSFCFQLAQRALSAAGGASPLGINAQGLLTKNGVAQQDLGPGLGDYLYSSKPNIPMILPRHSTDLELVTYSELLSADFSPARVAGKVVVMGTVADGSQSFQLSFQSLMGAYDTSFFADILGQQTATLLEFARSSDWPAMRALPHGFGYVWVAFWLLLTAWLLVPSARPHQWLVIGLGSGGALVLITLVAFRFGLWLPVFAPLLGIAGITVMMVSSVFRAESSLVAFADITQRALNRLPEPVFVKDSLGRIRMVNESFCRLAGLLPAALNGKLLHEVLPNWRIAKLLAHKGDYSTGKHALDGDTTGAEQFTDAYGRQFELNLITSRLPRAGRQDLLFGLVRAFHAVGEGHDAPATSAQLQLRFTQLDFWARSHGLNALVQRIDIEDFDLLHEAYAPEHVEKLLKQVHERLRRAFVGADAIERSFTPGQFWLMRKLEFSEDTTSQTRHALDLAFNWPFDVAGEKVELTALCASASAPIDANDFAGLSAHIAACYAQV